MSRPLRTGFSGGLEIHSSECGGLWILPAVMVVVDSPISWLRIAEMGTNHEMNVICRSLELETPKGL